MDERADPSVNGDRDWWGLHLWQLQPVRDIFVLLAIAGLIWAGYVASVVTIPLLLGLTLAYLFEPIVHRIAQKTGRPIAAGLTIAVVMLAIVVPAILGAGVAVTQGVQFVSRATENLPELRERLEHYATQYQEEGVRSFIPFLRDEEPEPGDDSGAGSPDDGSSESSPPAAEELEEGGREEPAAAGTPTDGAAREARAAPDPKEAEKDWLDELLTYAERNALQLSQRGIDALLVGADILSGAAFLAFMLFFLTPFFAYFMSVGLGGVRRLMEELIPQERRGETMTILHKMDLAISGFVRGRITISAILAVLFTIGYWLVGVPAPLILGPVVGLLSIVPYLALVGWPLSMLAMAVNEIGADDPAAWWWVVLGPSIVYWGLQTADDYLLTPLIQRRSVNLDTPAIMVAVIGGGALAGIYGVLLALPAAACIKILATDVFWPRYKKWVEGQARDPLPIEGRD